MKAAVIGGGLAGVECAKALSKYGIQVDLYEQKPQKHSPAHKLDTLAELVCSNSLINLPTVVLILTPSL